MDYNNIIYNGNFEDKRCWSGSNLTVANNVLSVTGNLTHSQFIPVSSTDTYKLEFDIKFNTTVSTDFYIALQPFDNDKTAISVASTYKVASTDTTLAKAIANGDTTITLTDGSKWDSSSTVQRIGVCNNLAWGYNRNTYSAPYASRSGNVITLKTAWAGGAYPVGTKVANFRDGGTYYYPINFSGSNISTDWKTYTVTFQGGDAMRYSCQYFKFSTLGYSNNYSIRNLRITNTTSYQLCDILDAPQVFETGNVSAVINEVGRRIRYIKDSVNGSNANTSNHWVEIQAINHVGANTALNKSIWTSQSSTKQKTLITDGNTKSDPYLGLSGTNQYVIVDLGFVEQINSLKIWHYWSDGRTYNDNVVSVSEDGVNWEVVYSGTHPETQSGFEIKLYPDKVSIQSFGMVDCSDIIEY